MKRHKTRGPLCLAGVLLALSGCITMPAPVDTEKQAEPDMAITVERLKATMPDLSDEQIRGLLVAAGTGYLLSKTEPSSSTSTNTLIKDRTLNLSSTVAMSLEKLVGWGAYVGVAYLITDPFNPNWEIEQAAFPKNMYHLSLKMKRYYSGGSGEARMVFQERAKELMRQGGFDGFTVVEYNESLDSSVIGAQRHARGVIQLTRS